MITKKEFFNNISFKNFILLYIFLIPLTIPGSEMGLITGILFIWFFVEFKKNKEEYFSKLKEFFSFKATLFMLLFLFFVVLSYFWSEDKKEFYSVLGLHKYFFFILPIIFISFNKADALKGLKVLALSFGFYAIGSFLIYLGILTWPESSPKNPQFLFRYMITGIYMVLGTYLLFYFSKVESITLRLIYLLISFFCFVGIFINNGRSAQVAFVVTLILIALFNFKYIKFTIKKLLVFLVPLTTVLIIAINHTDLVERYEIAYNQLKSYDSQTNYGTSSGQRIKMYSIGLEISKVEPILGIGAGDFKNLFHQYIIDNNVKFKRMFNTIHNVYLEYLIKFGIVGFSLFMLSFVFLIISFIKSEYFMLSIITIIPILIVFCFDSILVYKPFNNVFIIVFTLLCVIGNELIKKRVK